MRIWRYNADCGFVNADCGIKKSEIPNPIKGRCPRIGALPQWGFTPNGEKPRCGLADLRGTLRPKSKIWRVDWKRRQVFWKE